jgi:hypothetical protein
MATLLENIQDVCLELGLPSPSQAIGSNDDQVLQMVALMNRVGDTLATERDWQVLVAEHRFTTEYLQFNGTVTAGNTYIDVTSGDVSSLSTDYMITGNGVMQDTWVVT